MEMVKSLVGNKIKGDGNIQNNGDGLVFNHSSVNIILPEKELSKSLIFDLLQIFNESAIDSSGGFSLIDPADLFVKLEVNNASNHKLYALNYSDDFNKFDDVIKDFSDSSSIIKKLVKLFIENSDDNETGDYNLRVLAQNVIQVIKQDERYKSQYDEKLDEFVEAFILYGVYKCKILKNPNEKSYPS